MINREKFYTYTSTEYQNKCATIIPIRVEILKLFVKISYPIIIAGKYIA